MFVTNILLHSPVILSYPYSPRYFRTLCFAHNLTSLQSCTKDLQGSFYYLIFIHSFISTHPSASARISYHTIPCPSIHQSYTYIARNSSPPCTNHANSHPLTPWAQPSSRKNAVKKETTPTAPQRIRGITSSRSAAIKVTRQKRAT